MKITEEENSINIHEFQKDEAMITRFYFCLQNAQKLLLSSWHCQKMFMMQSMQDAI